MIPLTPALAEEMRRASAADGGHHAPMASHVFTRARQVVGATAIFAPLYTFWAGTKLFPRESLAMVEASLSAADQQRADYLAACSVDSPFHPLMPRLGFRLVGNADIFQRCK
jgi:hypothetical protein